MKQEYETMTGGLPAEEIKRLKFIPIRDSYCLFVPYQMSGILIDSRKDHFVVSFTDSGDEFIYRPADPVELAGLIYFFKQL